MKSGKDWRGIVNHFIILKGMEGLDAKIIWTYAFLAVALYISAGGAFIFGVIVGLPPVIIMSINHATIVYLVGQLTFMALLFFALYKISWLIVVGQAVLWNFLICKFRVGPKRPRGLRHPAVFRLQRRMNKAVVEGRAYGRAISVVRIAIVLTFCFLVFFPMQGGPIVTPLSKAAMYFVILLGGVIAITATMSAYRVGHSVSHQDFLTSAEGRKFAVITALFICMILGFLRGSSMMYGPTMQFSSGGEVCELSPMMPIQSGNLYYDSSSFNFVIMSADKIIFFVPYLSSENAPSCV